MSAPKNLEDCYTHELADHWSANEQMGAILPEMAEAATDETLKKRLSDAAEHIKQNTAQVKALLDDCGVHGKEHCKGMEGLVAEARKHALDAGIEDGAVRDAVLIAQYQRMCHYGICGFGTAKAFAQAIGKQDHVDKLDELTSSIYDTDENFTAIATSGVNEDALASA